MKVTTTDGVTLASVPLGENRPMTQEEADRRCAKAKANADAEEMGLKTRYVVAEA